MTHETSQKTNPAELSMTLQRYFTAVSVRLDKIGLDVATIALPNGEVDTVAHDLRNVSGHFERSAGDDTVYALGLVIGAALERSGVSLPEGYESSVVLLVPERPTLGDFREGVLACRGILEQEFGKDSGFMGRLNKLLDGLVVEDADG